MEVIPRPKEHALLIQEIAKDEWKVEKSIFKDYRLDSEETYNECFDTDWALSKCDKVFRDNQLHISIAKGFIKPEYQYIKEAYKYYSGLNPLGKITCIDPVALKECFNNCPFFVDNRTIKQSDIDLQVIACNSGVDSVKFPLNPKNVIVRH